jgi:hypothetical protein
VGTGGQVKADGIPTPACHAHWTAVGVQLVVMSLQLLISHKCQVCARVRVRCCSCVRV